MADSMTQTCSRCGKPFDVFAPRGICVHCVLANGLLAAVSEVGPISGTEITQNQEEDLGTDAVAAVRLGEEPGARPELTGSGTVRLARFGDYELLEEIARGGMGIVYKARQVSLNRLVALKMILSGQFASKQEVLRFRVEAEAAANLRHPNIVAIYETGEHQGQHFFSMEYVAGPNLSQLVGNTPLNPQRAARYTLAIARAIHYAHGQNTLHRDLKPSNVLVDAEDQPRITDFGLMRRLRGPYGLTITGQMLGSPNFMPPEQCGGSGNRPAELSVEHSEGRSPKSVTEQATAKAADRAVANRQSEIVNHKSKAGPWSDVYGIGAILYHLLTARPPFQAETVHDVLLQLRERDPVAPRLLNPSVPRDLEIICLKCLQKEPDQRYATANELADDLERFLHNEPIRARPVGRFERAWRWCRRKPALASFVAATILLLAAILIGSPAALYRINRLRQAESSQRKRAVQTAEERLRELIKSHVAAGNKHAERGDVLSAMPWWLEALRLEPDPARAEMHRIRLSTALRQSPKPTHVWFHGGAVAALALSPDGAFVATGSRDKTARVWDLQTGEPVTPWLRHSNKVEQVLFSSDGKLLLTRETERSPIDGLMPDQGEGAASIWRLPQGQLLFRLPHTNVVRHAEFSPDNQLVVVACSDGFARLWRVNDQTLITALAHPREVFYASFSPDARLLVTSCRDGNVYLWEIASGKRLRTWNMWATTTQPDFWRMQAKFNPDGQRVIAFNAGLARVWDINTNTPVFTLASDTMGINSAEYDPTGGSILTANIHAQAQVWNAANGVQQLSIRALEHYTSSRGEFTATYSEDSKWIVASDRTGVHLWDAERGLLQGLPLPRTFPSGGGVLAARLSAEARFLLMGCEDGTARAWDLISTEDGKPLLESSDTIWRLRLSADGQRLYTACKDSTVGFWNVQTGRPLVDEFPHHQPSTRGVRSLGLSDDQKHVFAAGDDGDARVYDAYTGLPAGPFLKHGPNAVSHAFLEGDHVCTGDFLGTMRIWNFVSGELIRGVTSAHQGPIWRLVRIPGSRLIASASEDRTVHLWNADTLQAVGKPMRHLGRLWEVSTSSDGKLLAAGSVDSAVVLVWDVNTQAVVQRWATPQGVRQVIFDPHGQRVVAACDDFFVRVWELRTGANLLTLPTSETPYRLTYSSDGRFLAAGDSAGGHVWDASTGESISPILRADPIAQFVNDIQFSSDGRRIATASYRLGSLWDLAPEPYTQQQWQIISEAVSGQRLNARGELEFLAPSSFSNAWFTARAQFPTLFANSDQQVIHRLFLNARDASSPKLWRSTLPYLDRLLARSPADDFWRKRRALAWLNLGDLTRAADDDPKFAVSPRDPRATASQIHLSAYYNCSLGGFDSVENSLSELPRGLREFQGTLFDVRGIVGVSGLCPTGQLLRPEVRNILIDAKCRSLHFLQATIQEVDKDVRVGSYLLHYADGQTAELPLVYGKDLRNWWTVPGEPAETPNASVAWRGNTPAATSNGRTIRLWKRTYPNPRPDVEVTHLDFVSAMAFPAPFVVAITVE